jgi:hypothetical protein
LGPRFGDGPTGSRLRSYMCGCRISFNARSHNRSGLRTPVFARSTILFTIASLTSSSQSPIRRLTQACSNATPTGTTCTDCAGCSGAFLSQSPPAEQASRRVGFPPARQARFRHVPRTTCSNRPFDHFALVSKGCIRRCADQPRLSARVRSTPSSLAPILFGLALTAGAFAFFILSQSGERPER